MEDPGQGQNIRHLRLFLAAMQEGSLSAAASRCGVSQPATSQAIARLESSAGGPLFRRTPGGLVPTRRAEILCARLAPAIGRLDSALSAVSPRLVLTATRARLLAFAATAELESFSSAARSLALSQPTVHRAVAFLEREAGRPLLTRSAGALVPTRVARELARRVRLALREIEQAFAELGELSGREGGRITIGSLPLARAALLPEALARFRALRPHQPVTVIDGSYRALVHALRRGDIDLIVGALRLPPPHADLVEEPLFTDHLAVLARPGHPLAGGPPPTPDLLASRSWAVPRIGTPARAHFTEFFRAAQVAPPRSVIECGSVLLMREILVRSDTLGCISRRQAEAEIANGLLVPLDVPIDRAGRTIGLTTRADWIPTRGQELIVGLLRRIAARDRPSCISAAPSQ